MQCREGSGGGQGRALIAAKQPDTDTQVAELLTLPQASLGSSSGQRLWRTDVKSHTILLTELPMLINGKFVGQERMRKQCWLPLEA